MTKPNPETGLVIRYDCLWKSLIQQLIECHGQHRG